MDLMLVVISFSIETAGTLPGPLYKEKIKLSMETEKMMSGSPFSQSTSKFPFMMWCMWFVWSFS